MVRNEKVTSFTIEASVGGLTFGVLGLLASEGEVNTEALKRDGSLASRIMTGGLFAELGG
jgi:hypothetical protein